MALLKCPECGREVSSFASVCPNCGYPISEMKPAESEQPKKPGQPEEPKPQNDTSDEFDEAEERDTQNETSDSRKHRKSRKVKGIVFIALAIAIVCAITIIPQKFIHKWAPATCTQPEICAKCGKTRGEPLPHDMIPATCETPEHCRNCNYETGSLADHAWEDATISSPKKCSVCGLTDGDPLPCIHSFSEKTETCVKCGRSKSDCPSDTEKRQIIDFMHERARFYEKEDGTYDPEKRDGYVWGDTKKEFTYLSRPDIDEVFFSAENPSDGELGAYRRKKWKQRSVEEQASQDTANVSNSQKPDELMLTMVETIINENFKGSAHENFYDSDANTYYLNVFMSGSSSLTYTSAFQAAASNFDSLSLTASQSLGIDFVASIWDGNIVVYSSKNGVGTYGGTSPTKASNPAYSATTGERNALDTAKNYLKYSAFSYTGLIDQLEFEGYSASESKYGADNCGADWNEQAAKSAEAYLNIMSFSKQGLIEQLEYEGFTHEQAVYGVEHNGY